MNYSVMYGLRPADRLVEPIFVTGLSKHHAIYLGHDHQGVEWIAENFKFGGVRKVKASEYFSRGKQITIRHFAGTYSERIAAVNRALNRMGEPYDLINFNCEHYAEYVQSGRATSNQINVAREAFQAVVGAALVISILNLFSND